MALCPSVPQRVLLPLPPASSLPAIANPESDLALTKLVDLAATCRLDYFASLVTESESDYPPSVGSELALGSDVLEDGQFELECLAAAVPHLVAMLLCLEGDTDALDIPTPRSYAEAISRQYSSKWQTAMDAEMASWRSTSTCVDAVPPSGANIVDGTWIFMVKRPPGSPPAFKARYVAQGFSQRQHCFLARKPSRGDLAAPPTWLHWVVSCKYPVEPPAASLWSPLGAPRVALGFASSTAKLSLFLRTDSSLTPFYILVYVDDLVFATADTEALVLVKAELHKRHTCLADHSGQSSAHH
ncbi:unnamed protein product [Closterium sp. NIES-53]